MAWSGYKDWLKKVDESGLYFSDDDLATAASDQSFAETAYDIKDRYSKAETDEERGDLHDQMEAARREYNYSGGRAGDESIHWDAPKTTPTVTAPSSTPYTSRYADDIETVRGQLMGKGSYVSPYDGYIQEAVSKILNRDPFSYDYASDPAYQTYKKEYVREGQRAQEDAMGQYAAMTGGVPSTAAMTAASQARDYYNAKLADKIPELYAAAYQMYQNEGSNLLQQLNMLRGLDSDAYGRWGDDQTRLLQQLSVLQGLDDTDYGRFTDQRDYDRGVYENDRNYDRGVFESDRAFDYTADQDQKARELALSQLGISLGDYSGAEALGITPDEEAVLRMALASNGRTSPVNDQDDTPRPQQTDLEKLIDAFNGGDHSDAVIEALLANGFTKKQIIDAGYTGDYFDGKQDGGSKWGDGEHARYVTNTIMTNAIYGGTMDSMVQFATEELEKGREDGSISEDEEDAIMKLLGF